MADGQARLLKEAASLQDTGYPAKAQCGHDPEDLLPRQKSGRIDRLYTAYDFKKT